MNTLFALMIVTASGVSEAPNNFSSKLDCVSVSAQLKKDGISSYCVEKKPVNIEVEMNRMMLLMKSMMKTMKEQE
jgi:hypothetical protein